MIGCIDEHVLMCNVLFLFVVRSNACLGIDFFYFILFLLLFFFIFDIFVVSLGYLVIY